MVLSTIKRLLEKAGHVVSAFQNPKEAIEATLMEDFDLIIADIRMPEIDGVQAVRYMRQIREDKNKPDIPEIFITGYAEDDAKSARALNPYAVHFKPFDLNEFLKIVNEALSRQDG